MESPASAIRRRGAEDLISGLPDEILHIILSRVPSPAAAARTSVLSRHWGGVWAGMPMPELVFRGCYAPTTTPSPLFDSIDAAFKLPAPPTFRSLKIDVCVDRCHLPAHRISSWLRFASQRVAGKLHLRLRLWDVDRDNREELALPIYERATEIDLYIADSFLRPPPTGSFSLLTDLSIVCDKMDGGELGRVVSSLQCPRLRKLHLFVFKKLELIRKVSIHSESLQCFKCSLLKGELEVTAPMLQKIYVKSAPEACIVVAPKLEKVVWYDTYDRDRHQVSVAGRHLQCLSIIHGISSPTWLLERFDTVSEMEVNLALAKGIEGYMTFLKEMDKLLICETLVVMLLTNHHAFAPVVSHLLRGCSCIRKFKLIFNRDTLSKLSSLCTMSGCPCHLQENYRLDDVTFDSLEEIGIYFFTGSAEQVEFVELLLSRCNMVILKTVDFMLVPYGRVSSEIMEAVQKIRSICRPNKNVQFNVR